MRILIITQHIFPMQTPRAIRSTELMKELARKGHDVTVYAVLGKYDYTPFEKEYNISIKNIHQKWQILPYNSDGYGKRHIIDKLAGKLLGKIFEFPYFEFYYRVEKIIQNEPKFDALISIAHPHQIHWGCAKAKSMKKFPPVWIADCGDPFMHNGQTKAHYSWFAKYEKVFCNACNYITVPHCGAIKAYYPEYREKIRVIPQGFSFDLESVKNNPIKDDSEKSNKILRFAYAGVLLSDIRNPALFLDYLAKYDVDFCFEVYTPFDDLLIAYKPLLKHKLKINKPVSRKQLLVKLKKMDFLVNIENYNTPSALPSKLIDYAITGKPILSINPAQPDYKKIDEFLNKNYSKRLIIDNIEDYHISNVVDKFIDLIKTQ